MERRESQRSASRNRQPLTGRAPLSPIFENLAGRSRGAIILLEQSAEAGVATDLQEPNATHSTGRSRPSPCHRHILSSFALAYAVNRSRSYSVESPVRSEPTERDSNSLSPQLSSTSRKRSRADGYEEGCLRGGELRRPYCGPSLALFEVALFGFASTNLVLHQKRVLSHD